VSIFAPFVGTPYLGLNPPLPRASSTRAGVARPERWQQTTLWLLILALAVYGYAGVLVQALGPLHWHSTPAETLAEVPAHDPDLKPSLWERVEATVLDWHVRALAAQRMLSASSAAQDPTHHPHHHHGLFERHHHDVGDATVVTMEPTSPEGQGSDDLNTSAATTALVALPQLLAPALTVHLPLASALRWPCLASPAWLNADLALAERPPSC
jgi:hypothetical protein